MFELIEDTKMVNLGMYVKDTVTGFTGILICQFTHLSGHQQSMVQPKCGANGNKLTKYELFDTAQLIQHEDDQVDMLDQITELEGDAESDG